MAEAMKHAVVAGRLAYLAGPDPAKAVRDCQQSRGRIGGPLTR